MNDEYSDGMPEPNDAPHPRHRSLRPAAQSSSQRLSRLVMLLAILLVVLIAPTVIYRVRYAQERARVDAALEGLDRADELSLRGLAVASRLVAERMGASVVHIRTVMASSRGAGEESYFFPFAPPREALGQGSGVIVDNQGYIVTNNHVVHNASEIMVHLSDGRELSAEVKGTDALSDIAVLKINAGNLIPATWGESDELEAGDLVWAVGSPYGLERTVTFGILSAKGRRGLTQNPYQDFLQSDAAVNPGNSGGPLVDIKGKVIGINTAIVGRAYQGISFAIPSAIAKDIYDRLKANGEIARGWLGVGLQELTPEIAERLSVEEMRGVLVVEVMNGSPADQGGIQAGDVILQWNGQDVNDRTVLSRLVAATEIGSRAKVKLLRDGAEMTVDVAVGRRPVER